MFNVLEFLVFEDDFIDIFGDLDVNLGDLFTYFSIKFDKLGKLIDQGEQGFEQGLLIGLINDLGY